MNFLYHKITPVQRSVPGLFLFPAFGRPKRKCYGMARAEIPVLVSFTGLELASAVVSAAKAAAAAKQDDDPQTRRHSVSASSAASFASTSAVCST